MAVWELILCPVGVWLQPTWLITCREGQRNGFQGNSDLSKPLWLRWEPGLVGKSKIVLSAIGLSVPHELPTHTACLVFTCTPNVACTCISVHKSCFPFSLCLLPQSPYLSQSLSVQTLNTGESWQTVKKWLLMATVHITSTMFQKGHRIHFCDFHLHSNP